LTTEFFASYDLLSATRSQTLAQFMTNELRRQTRHLCLDRGVLKLAVRPEFRGRRGMLVDLSAGGIGFLLADALEMGTAIVFELQTAAGEPMTRIARVRHCREHPMPADAPWPRPPRRISKIFRRMFGFAQPEPTPHAWFVGCEFDQPLTDEEIDQFLASLNAVTTNS
jgi:hypothetical protein